MNQTRSNRFKQKKFIKELVKKSAKPPDQIDACIALGNQLLNTREWLAAQKCFKHILKKEPRHFQALMKLAYTQACSGQLKQAIKTYSLCVNLQPNNHELLNNLAAMCLTLDQLENAAEYAQAALKLKPQDPNSHYLLAECLRLTKNKQFEQQYELALMYYQHTKRDTHSLIKISRALRFTNRHQAAFEHVEKVIQLNPTIPGAYYELGQTLEQMDQIEQAKRAYRRTLELAPHHADALSNYAELMARDGKLEKSAWAYRRLSKLFPDNSSFKHLLKASKEDASGGIDENYIKDVFDDYSENFEDHLVHTLGYQSPQQLHELFSSTWDNTPLDIMDLGCGTGLCGPLFKSIAKSLVGVDISQGMLKEAEKKKVYDRLLLNELVSALNQERHYYDLLIAADVLIYIGDLTDFFKAARYSLRDHGYLLFSIESTKASGFKLDASGRYKHSDAYIQSLSKEVDFTILKAEDCVIRMESKQAVYGKNYLLRKV